MKYGPGKFEGCGNYALLAQYLYEACDYDIGSSDELGWYGRFDGTVKNVPILAIVSEDSQGFVDVEYFNDTGSLNSAWKEIEKAYAEFYNGEE